MPHVYPSAIIILVNFFWGVKCNLDYNMYTTENLTDLVNKRSLRCKRIPAHDIATKLEVDLFDIYLQKCYDDVRDIFLLYSHIRKELYVDLYVTEILSMILFFSLLLCVCSFCCEKVKLKIYVTDLIVCACSILMYINFNTFYVRALYKFHSNLILFLLYDLILFFCISCIIMIIYIKYFNIQKESVAWYIRFVHTLSRRWIPFLIVFVWCLDRDPYDLVPSQRGKFEGYILKYYCKEITILVVFIFICFIIFEILDHLLHVITFNIHVNIVVMIFIIICYNNFKIFISVNAINQLCYSSSVIYMKISMYILTKTLMYK
ncbi:protein E9D [Elephant endotheliotropic herpesvirus 3A]|uniref:Protein E9D n=1 Tax=Elephant endotheliotropic herpesvirus 3A TaxID=1329409 RepID=A0A866VRZ3_9BETA|nr:protein E9D [Elephant endotheliotropic herpesvirus 3A]QOE74373.1 protein E9D [Elephant endotheliotropic herpesvirus 3A]